MSSPEHPSSSHHSLAFRVMRLCRPSFQVEDAILRLDPFDLFAGEDLFDDPSVSPHLLDRATTAPSREGGGAGGGEFSYRGRFQLQDPIDAMALPGFLMLPQSFGAIYLGETFCSYISVNNRSNFEARDVVIKAEIQTERQKIVLLDTSKSPVESIRSGGRYDFIVEHDVKELGPHTLVCTALYNDGDSERKYLPQFFKFVVANPLSVRTKVRSVKQRQQESQSDCVNDRPCDLTRSLMDSELTKSFLCILFNHVLLCNFPHSPTLFFQEKTFLEACIENHTKSNLYMDQVEFEPAQCWTATVLKADIHSSEVNSRVREIFKQPLLIQSGGGIHNFLYLLKQNADESGQVMVDGSNVLGKLQITWRTNLGESGRLQTQQILGSATAQKEIDIQLLDIPSMIILETPFSVCLRLRNRTERRMGPFEVHVSEDDSTEEKVVMVNGLKKQNLQQLDAHSFADFEVNMIAVRLGVHKISGITLLDVQTNNLLDTLPDLEVFVSSQ
ncbi:hypothetical protein Taro_023301 [Colocasia esculenta]|uniref:Trafficking protein particle complex subunit 13 n=1 Tax=Colocasia esculenta TaxID=4460 RepID=A0A843UX05_COLES|nr:hypothetical protein [Colocasia esculenta]